MNIQFKKGVLELCVLSVLDRQDCYGYELVEMISGNIQISPGTIYPLLRRLVNEGYCSTRLQESGQGPPRKYYTLTSLGKKTKNALVAEWEEFVGQVALLLYQGQTNSRKEGGQYE